MIDRRKLIEREAAKRHASVAVPELSIDHSDNADASNHCCLDSGLDASYLLEDSWRDAIISSPVPTPIEATIFLERLRTATRPVVVYCDDGYEYIIKGAQAGRSIISDHVVGILGAVFGAPTGTVRLVNVSDELCRGQSEMSHFAPGLAHGSRRISDCFDGRDVKYHGRTANRVRFARLAILYGWFGAADHQFLYSTTYPNLVHSVDHGLFLPAGSKWTKKDLERAIDGGSSPDQYIRAASQLSAAELQETCEAFAGISAVEIAHAVAAPPSTWGITMEERVALAHYLGRRRDQMLVHLCRRRDGV